MRWLALALACLALAGCESTQEKSAKLEREARRQKRALAADELKITRPSAVIKVLSAEILSDSEGSAVVVTVRNTSATPQAEVPLAFTVHGTGGTTVASNATPGLARSLTSIPLVGAHEEATWIDDQVQPTSAPSSATAEAGEGTPLRSTPPRVLVTSHTVAEEGGVATVQGTVANRSPIPQREVVIDAVASAGGRPVAAGRAVLASLGANSSSSFQIFLLGSAAKGATIAVTTAPTTVG